MKLPSFLWGLASFATLGSATPNPLPGSTNVTLRDPAISYNAATKKYYVFATGNHIPIFTAPSLTGPWIRDGSVLPNCTIIKDIVPTGNCSLWAPDVHHIGGRFVLYYSVSSLGSQNSAIGVASSTSMEPGTWKDHGAVVRSKNGAAFNAIDPNIIIDYGCQMKLTFGSWWGGIFQVNLDSTIHAIEAPPGTHLAGGNGRPAEGGFTYKSKKSPYLFEFFSDGITPLHGAKTRPSPGSEYKVRVGRGPTASGPFVDKNGVSITNGTTSGTIVLGSHDNIYAPGGQSLFLDPVSGRDVMVYHYVRNDNFGGSSFLGINYVDFSSGWPVLVN